ncbi:hypothetical protein ACFQJ7_15575 [Halovenus rubra]|uniref:Uncharacterized protein n=2 Tax=Halovenus rubra TaxID=869890 RepID=A0ACC7E0U2_9EURY|nr:hypothetical protein [Halovenus rubra]
MSAITPLYNALLVARLQLHRSLRRALDQPRTLLLQVGFFVAVWVYVVFAGSQMPGVEGATGTTGELDPTELRNGVRGGIVVLWLFNVATALKGTPTHASQVPGGGFLLRSADIRPTLWGTMLAEYARRLALYGLFAITAVVTLLWGLGLPTRDPLVMFSFLLLFLTAELTGMTLRLGVAASGFRLGAVGRVIVGGVGIVVVSFALGYPNATLTVLSQIPVANFAEAFLSGIPAVTPDRTALVWTIVVSTATIPFIAILIERLAQRTWFSGDQRPAPGTNRTQVGQWLESLGVEGPARAVAWRLWLQSRRKPMVLGLLGVPLLIVGLAVVDPEGSHFALFPLSMGLYAVWMTGFVLTLNPLSSEGGTLPHLLTANGDEIVTGYALTAAVIGLPVTVATIVAGGLLIGPPSLILPGMVVCIAVFLGTVPTGIAFGLILPRLEAVPIETDGPLTPGKFAMAGHGLAVAVLAAPAVIALYGTQTFVPEWVAIVGVTLTLLCSLAAGVLSRRSAARQLDSLMLD